MGVMYSAMPLNAELRQWLMEQGVSASEADGHAPTPRQLKSALETLDDQAVSFNISDGVWQAQIDDLNSPETGPWTMINVLDYTSPDEPCTFYFEKGWPELIIKVAHRIAQLSGPLVIVPDTGCLPAVVRPEADIDQITSTWEHLTG